MTDIVLRALAAHALQAGIVVTTAAIAALLLRSAAPRVRLGYWRAVVLLCLLLPLAPAHIVTVRSTRAAAIHVDRPRPLPTPPASNPPLTRWIPWLIAIGVAARLGWLGIGLLRLRTLRAHGQRARLNDDLTVLQRSIAPHADVQWRDDIDQPVTFGVRRPTILLPVRLRDLGIETQRAVVCHELLHARRRDWLATVFEECVCAVFWFHPAFWWAVARIQLCREETVDALAVQITASRQEYMRALLAFADAPSAVPAPPFTRRRHLVVRIQQLSKEALMSGKRAAVALAAIVVFIAASTAAVVAAFPMRTEIRYSTASAPQASTQSGGRAARDSRLISLDLQDADLRAVLRTFADITGMEFVIDPSIEGKVTVVVKDVPWDDVLVDILKEHHLAYAIDGKTVHITPASQPPEAASASPKTVRVGGDIRPPAKVRDVKPVYPEDALTAHVQGVVILEARIGTDGSVVDARVLRSIPMLDEAALEAVRQWMFMPTAVDGEPVEVLLTLTVNFLPK